MKKLLLVAVLVGGSVVANEWQNMALVQPETEMKLPAYLADNKTQVMPSQWRQWKNARDARGMRTTSRANIKSLEHPQRVEGYHRGITDTDEVEM